MSEPKVCGSCLGSGSSATCYCDSLNTPSQPQQDPSEIAKRITDVCADNCSKHKYDDLERAIAQAILAERQARTAEIAEVYRENERLKAEYQNQDKHISDTQQSHGRVCSSFLKQISDLKAELNKSEKERRKQHNLRLHFESQATSLTGIMERHAAELADLRQVAQGLRAQLPDGMQCSKIIFIECPVGHGRLTADNWTKTDCWYCQIATLQEQITKLSKYKEIMDQYPTLDAYHDAVKRLKSDFSTTVTGLQAKLSVATEEVKFLTEVRSNQAHLIKCLQSEVANLKGERAS
jgi:hypothetical protein